MKEQMNNIYFFDRGKIFYPFIMNYLILIEGLRLISARGCSLKLEEYKEGTFDFFLEKIGNLSPKLTFHEKNLQIDDGFVASEFIDNHYYIVCNLMKLASKIFVDTYEISKEKGYVDNGPLWEFLYHCRNAAAHNGQFRVLKDPKFPAEWRGLKIERSLNGTRLLKDDNGDGFLYPGDPIMLLWDIEQAYPNLKA
jgi:hypothetical protein